MSSIEIVDGKKVRIIFDAKKCIHSRGCVLSRPDVFVPNVQGEWIHPDAATPEAVAELAPKVNLARVRENGPLAFHGELNIAGQPPTFRATLCRCGASNNKPYCDGSHNAAGFSASGEVAAKESAALVQRDGAQEIKPARNGPLLVSGAIEVVSGTGKTVNRTTNVAFCRCGHSANKPYCDGTHGKIGFMADGV